MRPQSLANTESFPAGDKVVLVDRIMYVWGSDDKLINLLEGRHRVICWTGKEFVIEYSGGVRVIANACELSQLTPTRPMTARELWELKNTHLFGDAKTGYPNRGLSRFVITNDDKEAVVLMGNDDKLHYDGSTLCMRGFDEGLLVAWKCIKDGEVNDGD